MGNYSKAIIASISLGLLAGLNILDSALVDNTITYREWISVLIAIVGTWGVYEVTNKPKIDTARHSLSD